MILTADYHTHTPYSHGKNTVAENASRAKELSLKEIGIADHGYGHITYGISRKKIGLYKAECLQAEQEYGVKVKVGMEANILNSAGLTDMKESDFDDFDIFLCGAHILVSYATGKDRRQLLWKNLFFAKKDKPPKKLVDNNTQAYISVIKNNPVDILTHICYKFPANALEVAKCAGDYGTYIELNAKKQHLTDEQLCEIVAKTSARFVIGSDAHSKDRVGEIRLVEEQLQRVHFPLERIDNIDGRLPSFRFADYKQHR
jgi:putative hydrolase